MTRPVPLMFIKSPQASVRLPDQQEHKENSPEEAVGKVEEKDEQDIHSIVKGQLAKIQSPFGRHLYQPLRFKLGNEKEVVGALKEIQDDALIILEEQSSEELSIAIRDIQDILWRGQSLET